MLGQENGDFTLSEYFAAAIRGKNREELSQMLRPKLSVEEAEARNTALLQTIEQALASSDNPNKGRLMDYLRECTTYFPESSYGDQNYQLIQQAKGNVVLAEMVVHLQLDGAHTFLTDAANNLIESENPHILFLYLTRNRTRATIALVQSKM